MPGEVTAIAQAVGAISNTVTSFVNAGAQKLGLQKGMEADTIAFEQNKTSSFYANYTQQQKNQTYLIIAAVLIIGFAMIFKNK